MNITIVVQDKMATIYKLIFSHKNCCIVVKISLKFVTKVNSQ